MGANRGEPSGWEESEGHERPNIGLARLHAAQEAGSIEECLGSADR